MPTRRLYANRTSVLETALSRASELGLPEGASEPKRLEAWVEYGLQRFEEDQRLEQRVAAYEELAGEPGRRERIRRNSVEAVRRGLL